MVGWRWQSTLVDTSLIVDSKRYRTSSQSTSPSAGAVLSPIVEQPRQEAAANARNPHGLTMSQRVAALQIGGPRSFVHASTTT